MDNLHLTSKDNILLEEEYCYYSGLPSVTFYENIEKENMQEKESKTNWHYGISIVKSGIRIMAGITLINDQVLIAGILIILAEVFGIIEEL